MLLAGCVKQLAFQSTCEHVKQISMFTAVRKRIPTQKPFPTTETMNKHKSVMACSHRLRVWDKIVSSCRVSTIRDKTRQFCRVSNCVHTAKANSSKLGRDETKLSCRRCEQNLETRQNCLVSSHRRCKQAIKCRVGPKI